MFDYKSYYATRFKGVSNIVPDSAYPAESRVSPLDTDAANVMFPVNEETGNVIDLLTRLMRTENQLERQQILGMLPDNGANSPFAKVDDATKMSLLKPRSLQSFDEIASFRDVCQCAINQLNGDSDSSDSSDSSDTSDSSDSSDSSDTSD